MPVLQAHLHHFQQPGPNHLPGSKAGPRRKKGRPDNLARSEGRPVCCVGEAEPQGWKGGLDVLLLLRLFTYTYSHLLPLGYM